MKAASQKPPRWNLTPDAFDALINALGPDRAKAAVRYENLRRRLMKYFTWERCLDAEDRADETINRFARRLAEGEQVANAEGYCHGIARLIVREARLEAARQQEVARELRVMGPPESGAATETEQCFAGCLKAIAPALRNLLLAYYEGEKSQRIQNRQRLAVKLGISLNTLRNRALRLREKMETCTRDCLAGRSQRDVPHLEHTDE